MKYAELDVERASLDAMLAGLMFTALWENAGIILGSTFVTNYLFPIVSGVWLAFVTANLIMLRSLESRAVVALQHLRWDLIRMNNPASGADLMDQLFDLGLPVLEAADELESKGFTRTATVYRNAILRLQNPITSKVQLGLISAGIYATGSEDKVLLGNTFAPLRFQAIKLVIDEKDNSIDLIRNCETEWLAVFEVSTLDRLIEKHGIGRRSDGDGKVI